jgi:hypothetical protein
VGVLTTFTEYSKDTYAGFFLSACYVINDGTIVIVMDMTVTSASTDGTGLQMRLKKSHVGIKDRL